MANTTVSNNNSNNNSTAASDVVEVKKAKKRKASSSDNDEGAKKPNKKKKNSPRNTEAPSTWCEEVWTTFQKRLDKNLNNKGKPYIAPHREPDTPEFITSCMYPPKSTAMTVIAAGMEHQRPIHRIQMMLKARKEGQSLTKADQCSHICMDPLNPTGNGPKYCCNIDHMVIEPDQENKDRQRCPGWMWIHSFNGNDGDFWYPACQHNPPCMHRYTPKAKIPTIVQQELDKQKEFDEYQNKEEKEYNDNYY